MDDRVIRKTHLLVHLVRVAASIQPKTQGGHVARPDRLDDGSDLRAVAVLGVLVSQDPVRTQQID
jgi:hypothetical protein